MLLLPFLILAVSLGSAQLRRIGPLPLPEVALRPPVERIAIAPPPVAVPGPSPVYPPAVPEIAFPAPIAVQPAPTYAAPGTIAYPPPLPEITVAAVRPVPPAPSFVPPGTVTYPPPMPDVTVAHLDVRPVPVPAVPVPAPEAQPAPVVPVPPADDGVCAPSAAKLATFASAGRMARAPRLPRLTGVDAETFGRRLSAAALAQLDDLVVYTARYQTMAFPMGDVMALHGACIDVVVRAYRTLGIDLQEEVARTRGSRGDTNIDHRRTENMRRFLEKHGSSLPITNFPEDYKPGDIVTYHRPFSRVSTSHIAIVSDVLAATGRPMIVHNRGYGPQLEDALFVDRITGHYRYMGQPGPQAEAGRGAAGPTGSVVRASFPSR